MQERLTKNQFTLERSICINLSFESGKIIWLSCMFKKQENELKEAGRNAPRTPFRPACPAPQGTDSYYFSIFPE